MGIFPLILFNLLVLNYKPINTEDFTYLLGAPETFCEKNGTVRESSSNFTTIRIVDRSELGLIYTINVDFLRVDYKQNVQRRTLLAWQAVRNLSRILENSKNNSQVAIPNSMLIPGFQYIINVDFYNDTVRIKQNRIILDYNGKIGENSPQIQLKLLSADRSYNFIDYLIVADYSICSNITRFSFKWQLFDTNTTLLDRFQEIGSQLTIPPFTLDVDRNYQISCDLLGDNGEILAQAHRKFSIASKGLSVEFPNKYSTYSPHSPVYIRANIRNYDRGADQDMQILWSCIDISTNISCVFQHYQDEVEIEQGFPAEGRYRIDLKASQDDIEAHDYCIVNVVKSAPSIEIVEVENPFNPLLEIRIPTTVHQLRSFCTLQWTTIDDHLDLKTVPGEPGKLSNITVKQDLFLIELQEFSNDTTDIEYDLIIPPAEDDWHGLVGDERYMFRLLVTCPALLDDYEDDNENEPLLYDAKHITVSSDVIVRTQQPPIIERLEIVPETGEAFVTIFTLSSNRIQNTNNSPILYKFGYFFKEEEIIAAAVLETNTIDTVLPYSDKGVQIFVEVCDIYSFCNRIIGPAVKTIPPKVEIYNAKIQEISNLIENRENYRAFSLAFTLISYLKITNNSENLANCRHLLHTKMTQKVDELLEFTDNRRLEAYNYKQIAKDLIGNINKFNYDLQIPETLSYKLLKLHDNVHDVVIDNSRYIRRKILSNPQENRPTIDDIRTYLQTTESLIFNMRNTDKLADMKMQFLKKLEDYLTILCARLYQRPQIIRIELQNSIVSLVKFDRNSFNNFHTIPFERNAWKMGAKIKLNRQQIDTTQLCLGKMMLTNYFNRTNHVFMAKLFTTNIQQINQSFENFVWLPLDSNQTGQLRCVVYQNERNFDCETIKITLNYVQCFCKSLGYFQVDSILTNLSQFISDQNSTNPSTNPLNFEILCYIVIGVVIIAIALFGILLQCFSNEDDGNNDDDTDKDYNFSKYTLLEDDDEQHNDLYI